MKTDFVAEKPTADRQRDEGGATRKSAGEHEGAEVKALQWTGDLYMIPTNFLSMLLDSHC